LILSPKSVVNLSPFSKGGTFFRFSGGVFLYCETLFDRRCAPAPPFFLPFWLPSVLRAVFSAFNKLVCRPGPGVFRDVHLCCTPPLAPFSPTDLPLRRRFTPPIFLKGFLYHTPFFAAKGFCFDFLFFPPTPVLRRPDLSQNL